MEFKEGGEPPSTPTPRSPSSPPSPKTIALEIKRCEAIPWHKKTYKTQARMSTGGKGFRIAREKLSRTKDVVIISDDDDERKPSFIDKVHKTTSLRRSARFLGMKRKSYGEIAPRPMDYGGDSDWDDNRSPSSWGKAGDADDDEWYAEDEMPQEKKDDRGKGKQIKEESDDERRRPRAAFRHHKCCPRCREDIADLRATLEGALKVINELNESLVYLDNLVKDDYVFLTGNIRRLFNLVGEPRRQDGGARAAPCRCRK